MNTPRDALRIPIDPPKTTAKNRLYPKRDSGKAFRHEQKLKLDSNTTALLLKAQQLDELKVHEKTFSRTTIIRRATALYTKHLISAVEIGNTPFLNNELEKLLSMSQRGRK